MLERISQRRSAAHAHVSVRTPDSPESIVGAARAPADVGVAPSRGRRRPRGPTTAPAGARVPAPSRLTRAPLSRWRGRYGRYERSPRCAIRRGDHLVELVDDFIQV